jgi:hypothetical protein
MTASMNCVVVLSDAMGTGLARDLAFDLGGMDTRTVECVTTDLSGDAKGMATPTTLIPSRLLARLFSGKALSGKAHNREMTSLGSAPLTVLIPIGRFDDDVWTPILAQVIASRAKTEGAGKPVFAWTGLGPFLAPFGQAAERLETRSDLTAALLPTLNRSAPGLAQFLRPSPGASDEQLTALARLASLTSMESEAGMPRFGMTLR